MNGLYRVCPGCEGEFRSDILECPDCGLPLVERVETEPWRAPTAGRREGLAPSPDLIRLRTADLEWIDLLASRLDEEGIPSLVSTLPTPEASAHQESLESPERGRGRHYLFVRSSDASAAMKVDRQVLMEMVPEMDGVPDVARSDPETCPSCGARRPRGTAECPSCGLGFELADGGGS